MPDATVRAMGLVIALTYASFIGWLYMRQPQSAAEVAGGLSASIGSYRIDSQAFEAGLGFFRRDEFAAAGLEGSSAREQASRLTHRRA